MWIRPALHCDLVPPATRMRAQDAREIFALRLSPDPYALVGDIMNAMPHALTALVAGVDGEPCATAFLAVWPKGEIRELGDAALFATANFRAIARPLIAHVRETLIPGLMAKGVRRVEARCMEPHASSQAFLRRCGAVREALLPDYGPDGLDYVLFAWRKSDWR